MALPEQTKKLELQIEAGRYIAGLRICSNKTLTNAAKSIGISTVYLGEIEKGTKLPSDLLIRNIADFYNVNEDILFKKYGKIPLFAREEFSKQQDLQAVLSDISRRNIPEEQKQRLYDSLTELYREFLKTYEQNKPNDRSDNID